MKAKSSKRGYVVSTAVLIVLLAACWLVFRDKLPEILAAISSVSWRDAALILALGLAYQLLDALKGLVIVRAAAAIQLCRGVRPHDDQRVRPRPF